VLLIVGIIGGENLDTLLEVFKLSVVVFSPISSISYEVGPDHLVEVSGEHGVGGERSLEVEGNEVTIG
jgi:hypothetical protein